MTVRGDEAAARTERARAIGLFRYQLIREAADPALSPKARGRLVRTWRPLPPKVYQSRARRICG